MMVLEKVALTHTQTAVASLATYPKIALTRLASDGFAVCVLPAGLGAGAGLGDKTLPRRVDSSSAATLGASNATTTDEGACAASSTDDLLDPTGDTIKISFVKFF